MAHHIRVTLHAIHRYIERVLGNTRLPRRAYPGIVDMIRRSIAAAVPLAPAHRAIFADEWRGVNPNDEFLMHGPVVFVLSRPPRGGDATCVTIMVATDAQLHTIRSLELEAAHGDAFCAALASYFNITDAATIARIRSLITWTPRTLGEALALAQRIRRASIANLDVDGIRYFWGSQTRRERRTA